MKREEGRDKESGEHWAVGTRGLWTSDQSSRGTGIAEI